MRTSVGEFNRWLDLIPGDFDPHFIATVKGGKSPLVPKDRSWKEPEFRLGREKARRWLGEGGNVGFVAREHLVVLDVDDEEKARELLGDALWNTLVVSTRSGGVHLYFLNDGIENSDLSKVVEIRAEWRYVLVPGSYVDPGGTGGNGRYEVSNGRPPALLVPDDLPEELRRKKVEGRDFVPTLRKPGEPFKNKYGWTLKECRKDSEKLNALLSYLKFDDMPREAQRLFDSSKDLSRSGLDMSTAYILAYYEFDFGTCTDILREHRPYKKTRRDDYVETTVKKALAKKELEEEETVSDHHDPEIWRPGANDIFDRITAGGKSENG